ncbi:hypothetical protein QYM36_007921 [Artemia franciscana]|uniref:Uncharacterized protein n=1 Tax=Artemia franciscana TaxID=6661 RepID=A0AA88LDB3_ARTSF|nr:hypothetical protein QYM36_007921 [Artemia franciscana]
MSQTAPRNLISALIILVNEVFASDDESTYSENELYQDEEELNEPIILTVFQCYHLSTRVSTISRRNVPKVAGYEEIVTERMLDNDFKTHFRLHRSTFDLLLGKININLQNQTRPTSPDKMLLITLWILATPESYSILNRFSDLLGIDVPIWVSIPDEVNVTEIELSLQKPLIELQSDEIMRANFKDGKYNIWKTNDVATKYPLLWDKAQFYVIAFPTSYLVEVGFSRVSQILPKARNRLDIVKRGDLRLSLTSIEPNIKKLVEKHQPQGCH